MRLTLIAVSKTQPAEHIRALFAAGQRHFGENYAQELAKKVDALADLKDAAFHFIGHLQKNKIKDVVGRVRSIQTVDTSELALAIDRRLSAKLDVLIEVNIAAEAQKAGAASTHPRLLCRRLPAAPGRANTQHRPRPQPEQAYLDNTASPAAS